MYKPQVYEILSIVLGIYSVVATFLIIQLTIKIRRKKCKKCITNINEITKQDNYEDTYVIDTTQNLFQPINSSSSNNLLSFKPEDQPVEIDQQNLLSHHYEEISNVKDNDYNNIIQHTLVALSDSYKRQVKGNEVYNIFLNELMSRMRNQSPELYETINWVSLANKHQYEIIKETQIQDSNSDNDNENVYAKFISKAKISTMPTGNNVSFGSTDHLKYFVESKTPPKSNKDDYLEAKRFSALDNCPENLRKLCKKESLTNYIKTRSDKIGNQPKHSLKKNQGQKVRSELTVQLTNEKVSPEKSKSPPKLPPKLRKISSGEDTL